MRGLCEVCNKHFWLSLVAPPPGNGIFLSVLYTYMYVHLHLVPVKMKFLASVFLCEKGLLLVM